MHFCNLEELAKKKDPKKEKKLCNPSTLQNGIILAWDPQTRLRPLPAGPPKHLLGRQARVSLSIRKTEALSAFSISHQLGFWIFTLDPKGAESSVFIGPGC